MLEIQGNTELSNVRVTDSRVAVLGGPLEAFESNSQRNYFFTAIYQLLR
jgi:hypothetical protein